MITTCLEGDITVGYSVPPPTYPKLSSLTRRLANRALCLLLLLTMAPDGRQVSIDTARSIHAAGGGSDSARRWRELRSPSAGGAASAVEASDDFVAVGAESGAALSTAAAAAAWITVGFKLFRLIVSIL